ncbi:hypothetical protein lerEdw1_006561 [Lerista edwardsae]|nr:hypothetical protein lerEdw1_006561 [Lerista edwardsae]
MDLGISKSSGEERDCDKAVAKPDQQESENQDRLPSMDLLIGTVLFTVLSFGHCGVPDRPMSSEIRVPYVGPWGDWGPPEFCNTGHANGFQTKFLPFQGIHPWEDDTGLEGVRLICTDGSTAESLSGGRGIWSDVQTCPNGTLISFSMKVHRYYWPEAGDQTAANKIKFKCVDGHVLEGVGQEWGDWGRWSTPCRRGAICGLRTRVQPYSGFFVDDTGLNDVRFMCCYLSQ